jgi:hypothetical protein
LNQVALQPHGVLLLLQRHGLLLENDKQKQTPLWFLSFPHHLPSTTPSNFCFSMDATHPVRFQTPNLHFLSPVFVFVVITAIQNSMKKKKAKSKKKIKE